MVTRHSVRAVTESPSPFPEGWYFLAKRGDIEKAKLVAKKWMGENVLVWCDTNGTICVSGSICPHLGSYLGPEAGGCVRDGRLLCPFHGYAFDTTGQCVATPFAPPPKTAKLRVYETHEIAGMVFAWWGIDGRPPQWGLPEDDLEQSDWTDLRVNTLRFPGHPQNTTENSVDLAHLRYVHGYDSVGVVVDADIDGPLLKTEFDFKRTRTIARWINMTFEASARTSIYGLGFSYVAVREHSIGLDMRLWVLATPVDGTLIDLSLATQIRELRKPKRLIAGLRFLPTRWRAPMLHKFLAAEQLNDVLQDVVIWSRQQYKTRPRLCRSDGKIMPFRYYCAQFYPDPETDAAA